MNQPIITYKRVDELIPYAKNPRIITDEAVEKVANSIREFGFKVPIIIDEKNEIVAGHTRLKACRRLGIEEVPCIVADDLTPDQIKAFRLADNKVAELTDWDWNEMRHELDAIELDMDDFGFDELEGDADYQAFVEKFEPKLTTDDCYTPPEVYNIVKDWVVKEYGLEGKEIVRPFYPGGDYQKEHYGENCVVIDNPPFSILAKIKEFYSENNIPYFIFGPSLTILGSAKHNCQYVISDAQVIYENGAIVNTSFTTNLGGPFIRTASEIRQAIEELNGNERKKQYIYPDNVITAARLSRIIRQGLDFEIEQDECHFIRQLDSQKDHSGQAIYGSGFLISDKKAKELAELGEEAQKIKEEAQKIKEEAQEAITWELSEREQEIIRSLDHE